MGNKGSRSSKERASEADQPNPETKLSQNEVTHIWSHWESLKSKRRKLSKQVLTLYLKEHPRAIGEDFIVPVQSTSIMGAQKQSQQSKE